ncbi:winged helix-turn-helix domain-containing protein [Dactylosporangium sp. NPDC051541]|uniref:winged helix-turn-helix domain-containing protein n=1 Tax=Dactylosporangium sp. NPDC051541 TaxID=3363977 RepID=UPI0037A327EE
MTEEQAALDHPVRAALVALLRSRGTVTSTEAARELGGSSGLYSFHLRQLARYGLVEEVAAEGRARPWRLRGVPETEALQSSLHRGLEDESYQHWLSVRDRAPQRWRRDQAFSEVVYLTPQELTELGNAVRALVAGYSGRDQSGRGPVAAVARFFPLID